MPACAASGSQQHAVCRRLRASARRREKQLRFKMLTDRHNIRRHILPWRDIRRFAAVTLRARGERLRYSAIFAAAPVFSCYACSAIDSAVFCRHYHAMPPTRRHAHAGFMSPVLAPVPFTPRWFIYTQRAHAMPPREVRHTLAACRESHEAATASAGTPAAPQ